MARGIARKVLHIAVEKWKVREQRWSDEIVLVKKKGMWRSLLMEAGWNGEGFLARAGISLCRSYCVGEGVNKEWVCSAEELSGAVSKGVV